jgi:succinate dehydrogenase/fumarate reductase flavoprotein subunit
MDAEFDLVVVGAGTAGLLAAVAAHRLGERVLVVEADHLAGGSTAGSDGRFWLPANDLMTKLNVPDSVAEAAEYLEALLGPTTPASTPERRKAYVRTAGKLARWLTQSNVALTAVKGVPDHHSDLPGGKTQGRVLQAQRMDRRLLGEWAGSLRPESGVETSRIGRLLPGRRNTETAGEALAGQLLHRATANGVEVWLDSPVVGLLGDGCVTGVVVRSDGADVAVPAGRVLLASGGFERNQSLREEYLPLPTEAHWSVSGATNTGDLLNLAVAHGGATAALDDAWWAPVMLVDGEAHSLDGARGKPHSLIVDSAGDRFFNEAAPANTAGRALYDRSRGVRAVPSFLIMDKGHRQNVPLGPWAANNTPKAAIESGDIVRAGSLNDLATALGVDRAGLLGSVVRFNGFAGKGKDTDFKRGESAWDNAAGEAGKRRNPSLGKVEKPPFWAVKVYPGDTGTKGGLLIDATSRVLTADGTVLPGLYACGGAAASLFKGASPGPGAALGAALVEAFLAATDQPERRREL